MITPLSSNRTFFISNLLPVILTRLLFPWVLLRIDQVILGCGLPDAEMLRVRLPPSFMKINVGGFLVNLGGAVDMINHIKSVTASCANISKYFFLRKWNIKSNDSNRMRRQIMYLCSGKIH